MSLPATSSKSSSSSNVLEDKDENSEQSDEDDELYLPSEDEVYSPSPDIPSWCGVCISPPPQFDIPPPPPFMPRQTLPPDNLAKIPQVSEKVWRSVSEQETLRRGPRHTLQSFQHSTLQETGRPSLTRNTNQITQKSFPQPPPSNQMPHKSTPQHHNIDQIPRNFSPQQHTTDQIPDKSSPKHYTTEEIPQKSQINPQNKNHMPQKSVQKSAPHAGRQYSEAEKATQLWRQYATLSSEPQPRQENQIFAAHKDSHKSDLPATRKQSRPLARTVTTLRLSSYKEKGQILTREGSFKGVDAQRHVNFFSRRLDSRQSSLFERHIPKTSYPMSHMAASDGIADTMAAPQSSYMRVLSHPESVNPYSPGTLHPALTEKMNTINPTLPETLQPSPPETMHPILTETWHSSVPETLHPTNTDILHEKLLHDNPGSSSLNMRSPLSRTKLDAKKYISDSYRVKIERDIKSNDKKKIRSRDEEDNNINISLNENDLVYENSAKYTDQPINVLNNMHRGYLYSPSTKDNNLISMLDNTRPANGDPDLFTPIATKEFSVPYVTISPSEFTADQFANPTSILSGDRRDTLPLIQRHNVAPNDLPILNGESKNRPENARVIFSPSDYPPQIVIQRASDELDLDRLRVNENAISSTAGVPIHDISVDDFTETKLGHRPADIDLTLPSPDKKLKRSNKRDYDPSLSSSRKRRSEEAHGRPPRQLKKTTESKFDEVDQDFLGELPFSATGEYELDCPNPIRAEDVCPAVTVLGQADNGPVERAESRAITTGTMVFCVILMIIGLVLYR